MLYKNERDSLRLPYWEPNPGAPHTESFDPRLGRTMTFPVEGATARSPWALQLTGIMAVMYLLRGTLR